MEQHKQIRKIKVNIMQNDIFVDQEAKLAVPLDAKKDAKNNTFYIGKLQFNGSLNLKEGQTFMIFLSDDGAEEMQIGIMDPDREVRPSILRHDSRISVRLKKHFDMYENVYYVGELKGAGELNMQKGVFFTIFNSVEGREELQISPLKVKSNRGRRPITDLRYEDDDELLVREA